MRKVTWCRLPRCCMASKVSGTLSTPDAAATGRRRSSCTCEPEAARHISQILFSSMPSSVLSSAKGACSKCPSVMFKSLRVHSPHSCTLYLFAMRHNFQPM